MITLHERITHLINLHSTHLRHEWVVHSPILHTEGVGRDITKVNRFFRLTLGSLPVNTIDAREALYETHDVAAWLNDFECYVLPLLIKYNTVTHHHHQG